MNQTSPAAAGRVGVLISNEAATHTPEAWARAVTAGLIGLDHGMPVERQAVAVRTVGRVQGTLVQCFHEVRAASSIRQLGTIARAAAGRIRDIFAGTPWQMSTDNPQIAAEIERHILRNLTSAADHALAAE